MPSRKDEGRLERAIAGLEKHWPWVIAGLWLALALFYVLTRLTEIRALSLGDTDDNLRMMQVRALLDGQNWFDLRQYRLNPPVGANVHWSRLVDLPIAGLILLLRPFLGTAQAEIWAAGLAPMIPLLVLMVALALLARRLIDPRAFALPVLPLYFAPSASSMFKPDRIDHHGWQLALLAVAMAGIADPRRRRGGIILGLATALSLAIGLELLIYLAILGVAAVLFWVVDPDEGERLRTFALSASGGTALAFAIFASNDNRLAVCDALSPVWLSDALIGGALLFGLSLLAPADWRKRLALAIGAGLVFAAFHALSWPQCLSRLEGVSPEVQKLWLSHVREARPVYQHGWRIGLQYGALAALGAVGWALLSWRNRGDPDRFRRTLAAAAPAIAAALLLLWQTRTGPASQMMATVGLAALAWIAIPAAWRMRAFPLAVAGTSLVAIAAAGAMVPLVLKAVPSSDTARDRDIRRANFLCNSTWGMKPLDALPAGRVMSFVDTGPRLITLTHHDAVTGPYHRNGAQIVDVMHFWRGTADEAHAIARKYRSDYVLSCPKSSTSTIFAAEAPKGFYMQLERGEVPAWLEPIDLPKGSPFRMWRVVG